MIQSYTPESQKCCGPKALVAGAPLNERVEPQSHVCPLHRHPEAQAGTLGTAASVDEGLHDPSEPSSLTITSGRNCPIHWLACASAEVADTPDLGFGF